MELPLRGRRAVVTGASGGIGLAIARSLASAGARVALLARREEVLVRVAGEIGERAVAVPCDVTDVASLDAALARSSDALGGAPDILVNNAGLFAVATVEDTDVGVAESMLRAHVLAPLRLVRALLPSMRADGFGDLVTIGSVADRNILSGNAAYAPSKHASRALHEIVRAETRGSGVRAILVAPGPTDTPLWDSVNAGIPGMMPRGAMLRAEDVAASVLFALTRPPHVTIDELRLGPS